MARDDPKFMLRMPALLKAEIEREARRNGRSMNAEVVARLTSSIEAGERPPGIVALLREHANRLYTTAAFLDAPDVQAAFRDAPALHPLASEVYLPIGSPGAPPATKGTARPARAKKSEGTKP